MIQDDNLQGLGSILADDKFRFDSLFQNENGIGIEENIIFDSPYENCFLNCAYYSEDEFANCFKDTKLSSLLSLNIQGLASKFINFQEFLNELACHKFSFDIIGLQEIHSIVNKDFFNLNGYHDLINKNRVLSRGGGVGFYLSEAIKYKILDEVSIFHEMIFESLFIEAKLPDKTTVIIGNIYRSPSPIENMTQSVQLDSFIDILSNVVSKLSDYNSKVYILGDFNIDILQYKNHRKTQDFIDSMFASGFLQIINHPTRISTHANNSSATLIDHIWTNSINDFYTSGIITTHISDHYAPFCLLNSPKVVNMPKFIKTRNFSSENINSFKTVLEQTNFQGTFNEQENPQLAYDKFHNIFFSLFDVYFEEKTIRFNINIHKKEPWMSNGLLKSRRTKLELYSIYSKHRSVENKQIFDNYKNLYNKLLRAMKKLHYSKLLIAHQGNLKKSWDIIKEASNKSGRGNFSSPKSLNVNGNIISQTEQIVEHFNNHFTSITTNIQQSIPPTDRPPDSYLEEVEANFIFNFTSPEQIIQIFSQLESKSSTDFTGLSTKFVKIILPIIARPLSHIFNLSLKYGLVPSQFKIAKVSAVFKKGGKPENLNDYRSINLLLVFSKILEKLVSIQLKEYLNEHNIIHPNQFGFQEGNSTIHPMIHMLNKISSAMNKNEYTIGIFCDLTKAFDMVPVDIMCKKLEKIGIRGRNLEWFRNYLTDRQQFVCIDSISSTLREISLGLPQGSILGPILFIIFINDLPKSTLLYSLLFADDTTLLASGSNLPELVTFVNSELQKVSTWFRANKMSLHPLKTKFTIFHPSPHLIPWNEINIYINENNIDCPSPNEQLIKKLESVNHESEIPAIKFLGVYFDPALSFKYHIKQLNAKLSKSIFVLRRCKKILYPEAMRSLYYSTFHCHLIYGILAFSSTYDSLINDIFKQQKKAIRCISNAKYNSHTGSLFKRWGILPFPALIDYFKLNFMYLNIKGLQPKSFRLENYWTLNQDRNIPYALRTHSDFSIPFSRLALISRLPLISLPKTWNKHKEILKDLKNKPNFNLFKKHLKKTLIEKIDTNCNRLLCHICHLNAI